jgi:hypothetical protein
MHVLWENNINFISGLLLDYASLKGFKWACMVDYKNTHRMGKKEKRILVKKQILKLPYSNLNNLYNCHKSKSKHFMKS